MFGQIKRGAQAVNKTVHKYPKTSIGVGAYTMGRADGSAIANHNQNSFGDTYSKGRSQNRHPRGSY